MMSRSTALTAVFVVLAVTAAVVPVHAGITFEQKVTSSGAGRGMEMTIRGWAEDGKAKILYEESNNEIMGDGSYLLTLDGGETVYLINPKEKTYSEFDMAQMMSFLTSLEEASGGMVNIDFEDPMSETLATGPGEPVLGYATTHHKWRSGYTMKMKMAFMKQENRIETVTDAWVTTEVFDPGLYSWLRAMPTTTGDPELDEILTQDMDKIDEGLVLKMDQTMTTTNKKGKQRTSTTHYEVISLETGDVPDEHFAMPVGYEEKPLIPATEQQGGADEKKGGNPLKNIFG